nr:MAG TPA: hypothetical protein [Caudoviricetes sp.]
MWKRRGGGRLWTRPPCRSVAIRTGTPPTEAKPVDVEAAWWRPSLDKAAV